jgi:hypothetical protein
MATHYATGGCGRAQATGEGKPTLINACHFCRIGGSTVYWTIGRASLPPRRLRGWEPRLSRPIPMRDQYAKPRHPWLSPPTVQQFQRFPEGRERDHGLACWGDRSVIDGMMKRVPQRLRESLREGSS